MRETDIFKSFVRFFPEWEEFVKDYRRIGSRMIEMDMTGGVKRYFLYTDSNNWNFGTQPYRRKPDPNYKKEGK